MLSPLKISPPLLDSEAGWPVAVRALLPGGGTLHVHANVSSDAKEEARFVSGLLARIRDLADGARREWDVTCIHIQRVKWHCPPFALARPVSPSPLTATT